MLTVVAECTLNPYPLVIAKNIITTHLFETAKIEVKSNMNLVNSENHLGRI